MREFRYSKDKEEAPGGSPTIQEGLSSGDPGGVDGKETFVSANKKYIVPGVAILVGCGLIALFAALSHRPSAKHTSTIPAAASATGAAAAAPAQAPAASSLPTDQSKAQQPADVQSVSPAAIQGTASPSTSSGTQPLGDVQSFQQPADAGGNKLWTAPPYALAGSVPGTPVTGQESNNMAQARIAQVSKPSLVFVLSATNGSGEAGHTHEAPQAEEPTITNFGYQPGDHIAAHLEAVVTTATKAPAIAVVDYNYTRNGVTIIPAGSRIIGTIGQASSTGIMDIRFSTIDFPSGEEVPISAMGLDPQMGAIKGIVTGRNRGKQFLLATMAGLGATTAMFAGNNNTTGALSEGDMIRSQAAQNIGQAADSGISQLDVTEHLIVTVPAGTKVEVTFTSPTKTKKPIVM